MIYTIRIIVASTFLLLAAEAYAQTAKPASQQVTWVQCGAFNLPLNSNMLKSKVKISLKDGRKLKGKLISVHRDRLELAHDKKTETIACSDLARIERVFGFGHRLREATGASLMIVGIVVTSPGLLIGMTGAKTLGLIVATPGLCIFSLGYEITKSY